MRLDPQVGNPTFGAHLKTAVFFFSLKKLFFPLLLTSAIR